MGFRRGFLIGAGVGYVLGARAGRERYEQIREMWESLMGSPRVQQATEKTRESAGHRPRRGIYAVQRGVEKAGSAVKGRLNMDGDTNMVMVDEVDIVETLPVDDVGVADPTVMGKVDTAESAMASDLDLAEPPPVTEADVIEVDVADPMAVDETGPVDAAPSTSVDAGVTDILTGVPEGETGTVSDRMLIDDLEEEEAQTAPDAATGLFPEERRRDEPIS